MSQAAKASDPNRTRENLEPKELPAGAFITFEGGEGSGKSTQARRLAERLRADGRDVLQTREPGGSPFAERVRGLILDPETPPHHALAETLLFYAARADHWAARIAPALARGAWVVCDRFSDSTRVYQGYAGGLDLGLFDTLETAILASAGPSLTFVIDIAPEIGLARARARRTAHGQGASDAYEARELAFHERVRAGYLDIARREPGRCAVIDGAAAEDETAGAVWDALSARLGGGV